MKRLSDFEAIEKRKDVIPTDNYKLPEMAQPCANDEEAPMMYPCTKAPSAFTARGLSREKSIMNQA